MFDSETFLNLFENSPNHPNMEGKLILKQQKVLVQVWQWNVFFGWQFFLFIMAMKFYLDT